MTARAKFLTAVLDQLEKPVLMGAVAPDAFDCSELVAWGFWKAGGANQSATHTAQRYHDEARELLVDERPAPGDLGFYGADAQHVVHVVVFLAGGHVLSADGATHQVRDLATAIARGAKVRVHQSEKYRSDVPFLGWRRFTALDELDHVTR